MHAWHHILSGMHLKNYMCILLSVKWQSLKNYLGPPVSNDSCFLATLFMIAAIPFGDGGSFNTSWSGFACWRPLAADVVLSCGCCCCSCCSRSCLRCWAAAEARRKLWEGGTSRLVVPRMQIEHCHSYCKQKRLVRITYLIFGNINKLTQKGQLLKG